MVPLSNVSYYYMYGTVKYLDKCTYIPVILAVGFSINGGLSLAIKGFFLCPLFSPVSASLGCPSVYYKKNSLALLEVVKVLSSVVQEDVGEGGNNLTHAILAGILLCNRKCLGI